MLHWFVLIVLMLVPFVRDASGQGPVASMAEHVVLRSDGNELTALRTAPVPYRSLEALVAALDHALPVRSRAIRLVRASPPEIVEYVLCVTREGTLILGEQLFGGDDPARRRVLLRGELTRGYTPLEQDERWTWIVGLPLSREVNVTLEVRATSAGWPVPSVTIDVVGSP